MLLLLLKGKMKFCFSVNLEISPVCGAAFCHPRARLYIATLVPRFRNKDELEVG